MTSDTSVVVLLIVLWAFGLVFLFKNRPPLGFHILLDAMADLKLQLIQHERRIKELEQGKEIPK